MLSSALLLLACSKEEETIAPPTPVGETVSAGPVEVTVTAFEVLSPEFVDARKQAVLVAAGTERMAIVRLQLTNTGETPVTYFPQHIASSDRTPQLSTMPNAEGKRVAIERIIAPQGVAAVGQIVSETVIQPGATLHDFYLFRVPPPDQETLLLLVPTNAFGQNTEPLRFALPNPPDEVPAAPPAALAKTVKKADFQVTVTSITDEFSEAEKIQLKPSEKPLKYPYAYTLEPVLKIEVEIVNLAKHPLIYDPGHRSNDSSGVMLNMLGTTAPPLRRFKLADANAQPKGQLRGPMQLEPGKTYKDIFLFQRPATPNATLQLIFSGHIFGSQGLVEFHLDYKRSEPAPPDLEPYKKEEKAPEN